MNTMLCTALSKSSNDKSDLRLPGDYNKTIK